MTKIKKIKGKLGAPRESDKKIKNTFLRSDGGIDLIDEFVGIDYMIYEKKRLKNQKKRDDQKWFTIKKEPQNPISVKPKRPGKIN